MKKLLFFTAILVTNYSFTQVPTNGLVVYYPFNGDAMDESGNGYNGIVNGATLATDRNNVSDAAYFFNGTNANIKFPDFVAPITQFTYSLWFMPAEEINSETARMDLIYGDIGANPCLIFNYPGTSGVFLQIINGCRLRIDKAVWPVSWYHIVFRWDGTTWNSYLNGQEYSEGTCIVENPDQLGFYLGGKYTNQLFNGKLDDILIYNRALTDQEILTLYNEGGIFPQSSNSWQANGIHLFYDGIGNIGIGTDNPAAKLTVNGCILSTEVKVKLDVSTYPDFVFKSDYKLRPLKEVEQFINENGHLPEIPKTDEMNEGVSLGKMNSSLLQKIEELTLYIIEQNRAIDELKQIVKTQNEKIDKIETNLE
jgi:hypothetical protein